MAKIRNKILICLLCLTAIVFGFSAIYTFYNGTVANATTTATITASDVSSHEATSINGMYFKATSNAAPYDGGWGLRYTPKSADAVSFTRNGVTTYVGNTGAETIVKYSETEYYVESWTIGVGNNGWQVGDVYTLNGDFYNEKNDATITFTSVQLQVAAVTQEEVTTEGVTEMKDKPTAVAGSIYQAGQLYANLNNGSANGFYFSTIALANAPSNSDWSLEYKPLISDNVKITRGGNTVSVAKTDAGTVVKTTDRDYYLKFDSWMNPLLPLQDGDVVTVSGLFYKDHVYINFEETVVTYSGGAFTFSTDFNSEAKPMSSHESGGSAIGFYFTMEDNGVAHDSNWSVEYAPADKNNVKLTRGNETASVGNMGAGTIVKLSATDYYFKTESWMNSTHFPLQDGDVLTISGAFVGSTFKRVTVNIAETRVVYSGGAFTFSTPTVYEAGKMYTHGSGIGNNTDSEFAFYFKTDANDALHGNGDWNIEYGATSADNIKLTRGGETTSIAKVGSGAIVRLNEIDHYMKIVASWTVSDGVLPVQEGDVFTISGTFKCTSDANQMFNITETTVTYTNGALVYGTDNIIVAGQMHEHSAGGSGKGFYFTMAENPAPYNGWYIEYMATSADNIKVTRNGETVSVAKSDVNSLVKFDTTGYYIKMEEHTVEAGYSPLQEGDIITVSGDFYNQANDVTIRITETTVEYFRGGFYFSTGGMQKPTLINAGKMQVHPEHGGSSGGFYFTMSANDAPYEGWSLRYTPTSSENVKRIRGGETTNVGNTSAETIVKYSDTEYYCEGWPFGGIEEGDVFIFEGDFKNTAHNVIINIERTVIRYSNGKITIIEEELSMVEGAAIRFVGDGLRFIANLGVNPDMDAKYYVMIVPEYYLTMLNITENYYDNLRNALGQDAFIANMEAEPFQSEDDETLTSGLWYVQGSLVNILPENLNTEFFGIAYMVKDGVTTYASFTEGTNVRSIVEVSSLALNHQSEYSSDEIDSLNNIVKRTNGDVSLNLAINNTTLNYMQGYPISERLTLGLPEGADVVVKWESSAPDVIAVDELGNVIGLKTGSATITATCMGKTYTCEVTNQAGARPKDLAVKGNVLTWSSLANLERYKVTVNGNSYEVNDTVFDLEDLGLAVGTEYEISVCGIVNGVDTNSTKIDVTYYNYNDNNYVGALQGEKELPVGVWNGSIHFTHAERLQMLEELADAGITLVISVNPIWFGDLDSLIGVLDKAYELGVSFIIDVRSYTSDGNGDYYTIWDGQDLGAQTHSGTARPYTRADYLTHPAITQVLLWDEPYEYTSGEMVDKYGVKGLAPSVLRGIESNFESVKGSIGRSDLSLYTNLLPATAIAGAKNETNIDYATTYVDKYLGGTDGLQYYQDISVDDYPLLTKDGWWVFGGDEYIRKGYYYGLETLAKKALDNSKNFHLTILSSKHGDTSGTYYNLPDANVLRWQMAVGMAFGVTNLTHYTLGTHATDYEAIYMKNGDGWAKHSTLFNDVSTVNNEYLAWDEIYRNYKWQGYSTVDKGGNNSMIKTLQQKEELSLGLNSATISTSSRAVLIGKFQDGNNNSAFMITNAGYATDSNSGKFHNISYTMNDAEVTLEFDGGYVGAWVINRGVKTYNPLSNNQLTVDVKAWDGVFVIPVKAKGNQLATATIDGFDKATSSVVWNSVENASAYEVVITRDGKTLVDTIVFDSQKDGSGKLSVALNDLVFGEYTVKITARNDGLFAKGKTAESKFTLGLKQN